MPELLILDAVAEATPVVEDFRFVVEAELASVGGGGGLMDY